MSAHRVLVPGPTCGYTMKKEWPVYVGTEAATLVAGATLASISPVSLALQGVTTAAHDYGRANAIYGPATLALGILAPAALAQSQQAPVLVLNIVSLEVTNGQIVGLSFTNFGSGYTIDPNVTLTGGGGSGATGEAGACTSATTVAGGCQRRGVEPGGRRRATVRVTPAPISSWSAFGR